MSSFQTPHKMYLFDLRNGKKKLGYGSSAKHALKILSFRLSEREMSDIIGEKYTKISQCDLKKYVKLLG